jgi:hypothetical protein
VCVYKYPLPPLSFPSYVCVLAHYQRSLTKSAAKHGAHVGGNNGKYIQQDRTFSSQDLNPAAADGTGKRQGLTLAHFKAQREDLRDTSLTLQLNLSTFGPRPRINLGHMGDKLSSS